MAEFIASYSSDDDDGRDGGGGGFGDMAHAFGPGHADQMIRHGVLACWMALPAERRNIDELEKQLRRLIDRALRDFREDQQQFGSGPTQ